MIDILAMKTLRQKAADVKALLDVELSDALRQTQAILSPCSGFDEEVVSLDRTFHAEDLRRQARREKAEQIAEALALDITVARTVLSDRFTTVPDEAYEQRLDTLILAAGNERRHQEKKR